VEGVERHKGSNPGPWKSGLFYLFAAVVLTVVFMVAASILPWWTVPVVIVGALIGLVVLGAFQLRQDGKISEKGLISLITASFRAARSIATSRPPADPGA
jgi:Flp pilus assembly protein TadB